MTLSSGLWIAIAIMWGDGMTITYYTYNAEKNRINKQPYLTQIGTAAGVPVGPVDVINPAVLIEAAAPAAANYAYIDTYSSYYWISEISGDSTTQSVLTLRRDPLMTFKDQIFACPCVCDRTAKANKGTLYIHDPILRTNQFTLDGTLALEPTTIFGYNGHILLMTVG